MRPDIRTVYTKQDLRITVEGKTFKQVNFFYYLGSTVCGDGSSK